MAGLEDIKKAVEELMDLARRNYNLEMRGKEPIRLHLNRVFLGSPGTGKTTTAKLFAQIVTDIRLISKGGVVFTSESDFVLRYIGAGKKKMREVLAEAEGKVLIIDDTHGLLPRGDMRRSTSNSDSRLFSILDTLVAETSTEPGQDRCIILVGYPDSIHDMFARANPGLRSRFPIEDAF